MTKKDLRAILSHWIAFANQRQARVSELLDSNNALLERARAAETDRRLALDLLAKCVRLLSAGVVKDEVVAFLKERAPQ